MIEDAAILEASVELKNARERARRDQRQRGETSGSELRWRFRNVTFASVSAATYNSRFYSTIAAYIARMANYTIVHPETDWNGILDGPGSAHSKISTLR